MTFTNGFIYWNFWKSLVVVEITQEMQGILRMRTESSDPDDVLYKAVKVTNNVVGMWDPLTVRGWTVYYEDWSMKSWWSLNVDGLMKINTLYKSAGTELLCM